MRWPFSCLVAGQPLVYFASGRGGALNIWKIAANSGEDPIQVTADQGQDAELDVSSDGTRPTERISILLRSALNQASEALNESLGEDEFAEVPGQKSRYEKLPAAFSNIGLDLCQTKAEPQNFFGAARKLVFTNHGKRIGYICDAWREAAKRAGLPGLLLHDCRRTAVGNFNRAGVPDKTAMAISGHKTRSVFDRYNIVDERDLRDATAKLERHLRGGLGTVWAQYQQLQCWISCTNRFSFSFAYQAINFLAELLYTLRYWPAMPIGITPCEWVVSYIAIEIQ